MSCGWAPRTTTHDASARALPLDSISSVLLCYGWAWVRLWIQVLRRVRVSLVDKEAGQRDRCMFGAQGAAPGPRSPRLTAPRKASVQEQN